MGRTLRLGPASVLTKPGARGRGAAWGGRLLGGWAVSQARPLRRKQPEKQPSTARLAPISSAWRRRRISAARGADPLTFQHLTLKASPEPVCRRRSPLGAGPACGGCEQVLCRTLTPGVTTGPLYHKICLPPTPRPHHKDEDTAFIEHLLYALGCAGAGEPSAPSALRAARAVGLPPHPRGRSAEELRGRWGARCPGRWGGGFRPEGTFHRVVRRDSANLSRVRRKNLPAEEMEV